MCTTFKKETKAVLKKRMAQHNRPTTELPAEEGISETTSVEKLNMLPQAIFIVKKIIKIFLYPVVIYRIPSKFLYLTFDDGPDPTVTPQILNILDSFNILATFFVEGRKLEQYPEIVQKTADMGHALGYHSYKHNALGDMSLQDLVLENRRMISLFTPIIGNSVSLLRPPFGNLTAKSLLFFWWNNKTIVQWSIDSKDSLGDEGSSIILNMRSENIRQGDILLFHDDSFITIEVLPTILNNLLNSGYKFKRLRL